MNYREDNIYTTIYSVHQKGEDKDKQLFKGKRCIASKKVFLMIDDICIQSSLEKLQVHAFKDTKKKKQCDCDFSMTTYIIQLY